MATDNVCGTIDDMEWVRSLSNLTERSQTVSARRKLIVVVVLASVVSGLLGGPVWGASVGRQPGIRTLAHKPETTFKINPDDIYVPITWIDKASPKEEISLKYWVEMILDDSNPPGDVILRFRGTETNAIDGAWGAIFAVLPEELNVDGERAEVEFLDASFEPVEGYPVPFLKDPMMVMLKEISPSGVGDIAEQIFKAIGVGGLGDIDTEGTLFDEPSGYTPIAKTWDDTYWEAKWIKGAAVQIRIPLGVAPLTAQKTIQEKGVGVYFHLKPKVANSQIGILMNDLRFDSSSLEQPLATVPDAGTLGEVEDIWVRPADGMEMVLVPGGEFQMGSTDAEVEQAFQTCQKEYGGCQRELFEPEQPVHAVALDGFWLDRTEVTNEQYRLCVEAGVCDPSMDEDDSHYNGDDQPVVGVYWNDAQTYCQWAGARLPTEAEWEYAARGPEGRVYPWGSEFDGARCNYCDRNCSYDWADESVNDGYEYAAPVGSYPDGASWVGVLDMSGNVWEWVADWYGDYPSGKQVNPTGPASGDAKVVRGGSWGFLSIAVPGAFRDWYYPDAADYDLGFRCARNS